MADKFLNLTDLVAIKAWIEGKFALDADLDDLAEEVSKIIAEGGEPNVIEIIKKNGTALTPDANKAVDMSVPTVAKSGSGETEKITITDGQNTFDAPTVGAMEDYVSEHGGVIQKIKNNGTEMPIDSSDKSVNFTNATSSANGLMSATDKDKLDNVEAGAQANVQPDWNQATSTEDDFIKNKPTNLSDFVNDGDGTTGSTFPTTAEMEEAIGEQIGRVYKPAGSTIFANLPALSASELGNVYNVEDSFVTTADFKEGAGIHKGAGEDVAIINIGTDANPVYKYNCLSGMVDLSAYWTSNTGQSNTLVAATVAEVNAVLEPTS